MGETANTGGKGDADASNTPQQPGAQPASETDASERPGSSPESVKIERVDLSRPRQTAAPKAVAPAAFAKAAEDPTAVFQRAQDDIAHILDEVKLPERNAPAIKAQAKVYDTSLATDPAKMAAEQAKRQARVREAARAVTESLPTSIPKTTDDVRPLHTLKDDLQDVVRNKKISLVRAVALEEEKKHRPRIASEEQALAAQAARRRSSVLLIAVFLFLFGASALGVTYFVLNSRAATSEPIASSILFAEQTVPFPLTALTPADVRREIANARNSATLTLGAILQIVPVQSVRSGNTESLVPVTFGEFMGAIGAQPPEELVRALSSEFFFGMHTVDENAPLFIVPVTSYERAFAAMLAWEKTLNQDLAPIFTPVPSQTVGPDGLLVERVFEDTVIHNYDVRVLKDESGTIQLYYSFPTRNVLIIAESQYSFTELLSRLRADRRL